MDETTMKASLPNLDVEITRRASDDGRAELVTMTLRATPDLESVARLMAPQMLMLPLLANPFMAAWARMMQQAWSPWLTAPQDRPAIGTTRPPG